jgi:hypothetical protein
MRKKKMCYTYIPSELSFRIYTFLLRYCHDQKHMVPFCTVPELGKHEGLREENIWFRVWPTGTNFELSIGGKL